jgi:aquaporin related protein
MPRMRWSIVKIDTNDDVERAENIVLPGVSAKKINLKNGDHLEEHRRSAILAKLPPSLRGHVVAVLGEFVGTFMFLFFAFSGTQVANTTTAGSPISAAASVATAPNTSNLLYVSLAFGFSLAVNAWVFFRVTGGLFNPAVSSLEVQHVYQKLTINRSPSE